MNDTYKTIGRPAEGIYREKGSKFLAFAYPVEDEEAASSRISALKKKYHDARHHCYAWRLGPDMERYRVNDDGEPSGSAGHPIFGQIRSRELTQVLVVVVRYFGGTLLGVGGLINAYRSAAADALGQAGIAEKKVVDEWTLEFGYARMNQVMKTIGDLDIRIIHQDFGSRCNFTLQVWQRQAPKAMNLFQSIGGCEVQVVAKGKL